MPIDPTTLPTPVWSTEPPRIGATATLQRRIETADIARFTAISGDRNPIHFDDDAAARTPFGRIVVQGGVITAILNAVVAERLPGPGSVFLHTDWSFRAPVHPGDVVTGRVEVLAVREDKPIVHLATTVVRDDGTVSVEGTALTYTFPLGPLDEDGRTYS
jgi:acyl dehydratase